MPLSFQCLSSKSSFFDLVNQASSGPFRGTAQGEAELQSRMVETDWNDAESVLAFAKGIIEAMRAEDVDKQVKDIKRLYDLLFSFEYFNARYELRLGGNNLNQLSPGEKGLLLLVFYLHLDMEKTPLIIDQCESAVSGKCVTAWVHTNPVSANFCKLGVWARPPYTDNRSARTVSKEMITMDLGCSLAFPTHSKVGLTFRVFFFWGGPPI